MLNFGRTLAFAALMGATASFGLGAQMLTFDSPDTWNDVPGDAGGGWHTGWTRANGNSTSDPLILPNRTKDSVSPLTAGAGSYLHVEAVNNTGAQVLSRRLLTTTGTDDFEQPHVVSFDYRTSAAVADEPTLFSQSNGLSTNTTLGYMIRPVAGFWSIYNAGRNGGSFSAANWVPTTVTFTADTTYHFDITVDPTPVTGGYYDVSINGVDFDAPAAEMFGFRGATFNDKGYINFSVKGSLTTTKTFDVDNLVVVVPEPATLGLLAISSLAMLRRRKA